MKVFKGIILAAVLLSCQGPTSDQGGKTPNTTPTELTIRLLVANLTSGTNMNYDLGHGLRIIQGTHPDVVFVQKFSYGSNTASDRQKFANLALYQTETPAENAYYFCDTTPASTIPNGILSKYPITNSGIWVDSQITTRAFSWAVINLPGSKELLAVSVYFVTLSEAARSTEAKELTQKITDNWANLGTAYLAIGGDLNTTKTTEACFTDLSSKVIVTAPYPADASANVFNDGTRTKQYTFLLADSSFNALGVPTVIGQNSFANGAVIDTRIYTPIDDILPALNTDSGATNMQHMALIRDFKIKVE